MPEIALVTDQAGTFEVALPPGRYRLQAVKDSGRGETEFSADALDEIVIELRR